MTITIPKELEPWVFLLVGEDWPHVDEVRVRALAAAWRRLGADLEGVVAAVQAAASAVGGSGRGPGVAAATNFLDELAGGANSQLPQLRKSTVAMAGVLDAAALKAEQAKILILMMAVFTLVMVAKLFYLAILTFGAAATAVKPFVGLMKAMAMRLLHRLVESLVVGFLFMFGLDAGSQLVQAMMGTRKHWDYQSSLTMGGLGALGGAIGFGLGWMRGLPGGRSIWVSMLKEALVEGLPELVGGMTGVDGPRSFLGGLLSGGLVEGPVGHLNKGLGRRLPNAAPLTNWSNLFSGIPTLPASPVPSLSGPPGAVTGGGSPPGGGSPVGGWTPSGHQPVIVKDGLLGGSGGSLSMVNDLIDRFKGLAAGAPSVLVDPQVVDSLGGPTVVGIVSPRVGMAVSLTTRCVMLVMRCGVGMSWWLVCLGRVGHRVSAGCRVRPATPLPASPVTGPSTITPDPPITSSSPMTPGSPSGSTSAPAPTVPPTSTPGSMSPSGPTSTPGSMSTSGPTSTPGSMSPSGPRRRLGQCLRLGRRRHR